MTPGDDVRDLWGAVNSLRQAVADLGRVVGEIRALLSERCEARAEDIRELRAGQAAMAERLNHLDRRVIKWSVITGIISSVMSASATAVAIKAIGAVIANGGGL